MHLYKRKDSKYWWFKFSYHGKVYQQSTGTKNRRDAEGIASKARLDVIEGKSDIRRKKATPLFKEAMAEFLAWSKQHHAAHPNTTIRYTAASKPLLAAFGAKPLDTITPDDVEKYKAARLNQHGKRGSGTGKLKPTGRALKPATVNRELACLKAMFNHFIKREVLAHNPVTKVKLLAENNEQMRVLSFEEERLYLAACSQPLHDFAVIMLETGMRPDEVRRITKTNVKLAENYVYNPHGKTKAARRKLPLTVRAAEVLRQRIEQATGAYLFPHENDPDQPMIKPNNAHYGALRRSGIAHCRLYDLRHSFASRAAMSGVDLVTLATLLGHSKIQMVLRYAHPTEEHQVSAIKKLESFTLAGQMAEAAVSALIQ